MEVEEARTLVDYAYWARDKLLAKADGLSDEEFSRDNGFNYKSLRGILVHAMDGEAAWCTRFLGGTPEPPPGADELTSVAALRERWSREESKLRGFLNGLTAEGLHREISLRRRTGEEVRASVADLIVHVVNHGTQHRSEAAEALTMIGRSPGSLDFTTFLWSR